jgi:uncharacterized protein YjiS (DUF1127 family)
MKAKTCITYRSSRSAPNRSAAFDLRGLSRFAAQMLERCYQRCRQRAALAELDARLLNDVGLSRGDVEGEVAKPFWRE